MYSAARDFYDAPSNHIASEMMGSARQMLLLLLPLLLSRTTTWERERVEGVLRHLHERFASKLAKFSISKEKRTPAAGSGQRTASFRCTQHYHATTPTTTQHVLCITVKMCHFIPLKKFQRKKIKK